MPDRNPLLVGLAVGEGTGPELAAVFEDALTQFAAHHGVDVRIERAPLVFRTFGGVVSSGLSAVEVARSAEENARAYEDFVRGFVGRGGSVIFRTAFNAQPLYSVRERLECVKLEVLPRSSGELLLVRDQVQGFYTGDNNSAADADVIRRTCTFSREKTFRVLDFALDAARRRWGSTARMDHFVLAYKFHLLDRRFEGWVAEYGRRHEVVPKLCQPDTVNRGLLRSSFDGNTLLVAGNEWGDIMHADLLSRFGLGSQEERCTRNVYLATDVAGLVEYQTVHGSADDIGGRGVVNPAATLLAAAHVLEEHGGSAGLIAKVGDALGFVARRLATPDAGGTATTEDVSQAVIQHVVGALHASPVSDVALIAVDMQHDFCAPDGRFAELGLVDGSEIRRLVSNLAELVTAARERGVPVVFVQSHAEEALLPANVVERNEKTGRTGMLKGRGAAAFGVTPLPHEKIVLKGGYDAFLGTDLEAHLRALGTRELVLTGVFSDLCVDALARTAYQKGFRVRLVVDATLPLERGPKEAAEFMARYYDASLETSDEVAVSWRSSERGRSEATVTLSAPTGSP